MYSKILVSLTALVAAFLVVSVHSIPRSNNFTVGYRLPGDKLMLAQDVEVKSKWMQVISTQRVFNVTKFQRITKVEAIDKRSDGTGAHVFLIKGGPTYQNVTLRFNSQRNHGIHFRVNLYAR